MPTDYFSMAWAGPIARGSKGVAGAPMDASNFCDSIAETLMAGGWTLVDKSYPRQFLYLYDALAPVTGVPLPDEEKTQATCDHPFVRSGETCGPRTGKPLAGWDPGREFPPPCDNFEYGDTGAGTAVNLAGAITTTTPADAYMSPGVTDRFGNWGIGLRAKTKGTELNGFCFHGDASGARVLTGALTGGGYKLRSQTYNGTYIELVVTPNGADEVRLDWAVNQSIVLRDDAWPPVNTWPVAAGQEMSTLRCSDPHTYTIWACPYQMAIWARDIDGDTGGGAGTTACFASIPRVPVDHPGYGQAFILPQYYRPWMVYGGNMRTSLTYDIALISEGSSLFQAGGNVGIAGFRLPDHPLLTAEGKPILQNPYVWTRRGAKEGIIGQLWNCTLLSSHLFQRDSKMIWDDRQYLCMSKQVPYLGSASGSLWLAVNE